MLLAVLAQSACNHRVLELKAFVLMQALEIISGRFGLLCGPSISFDELQAACGSAHILYCIDDGLVGGQTVICAFACAAI